MRKGNLFLTFIIFTFLPFFLSHSKEKQPEWLFYLSGNIRIFAGQLIYLKEEGVIQLLDGVSLRSQEISISSKKASIDLNKHYLHMEREVIIKQKGSSIRAKEAGVILDGEISFYKKARICLGSNNNSTCEGGIKIEALYISKDHSKVVMKKPKFDACSGCNLSLWNIAAKRGYIDLDRGYLILSWPRFNLLGIPIFLLPTIILPTTKRKSGLLFPKGNYTERNGLFLEQPLYLVLSDPSDITYYFGWFSKRGIRHRLELRWLPMERMTLDINGGYIFDKLGKRYRFAVYLSSNYSTQKTFVRSKIAVLSDPDYISDFYENIEKRGTDYNISVLSIYRRFNYGVLGSTFEYMQSFKTQPDRKDFFHGGDSLSFHRVPSLFLYLYSKNRRLSLRAGLDHFSNFFDSGWIRGSLVPEANLPFFYRFLSLSTQFKGYLTYYDNLFSNSIYHNERFLLKENLDIRAYYKICSFLFLFNPRVYFITPIYGFRNRPEWVKPMDSIDLNIGKDRQIKIGFQNRLLTKNINSNFDLYLVTNVKDSDLETELVFDSSFYDILNIELLHIYSLDLKRTHFLSLNLDTKSKFGGFYAKYTYNMGGNIPVLESVDDDLFITEDIKDLGTTARISELTLGARLGSFYGVVIGGSIMYDLTAQKDNRYVQSLIYTTFGPYCNCWKLRFDILFLPDEKLPTVRVNLDLGGLFTSGSETGIF